MKTFNRKKQNGSLLIDVAAAIIVIGSLAAYAQAKSEPVQEHGDEQILINEVATIISGARKLKSTKSDGLTTVSMTALSEDKYISSILGNGTGKNPFGGNYTITQNGTNGGMVDVAITGLPAEVCTRVKDMLLKTGTATCTTGTVALTTL
tara:strand:+ start:406 stop:855 length:450 start_codon:yes stop_codon:yes gene_type:complete